MKPSPKGVFARLIVNLRLYARQLASTMRIAPPASAIEQPRLWLIAVLVGALSGYTALGFVMSLRWMNRFFFGGDAAYLTDAAADAPWWVIVLTPMAAGALVGLTLRFFHRNQLPFGVADVIEARALRQGRIDARGGALSTLAALVSLGGGASAGREGPVVVAGASFAALVSNFFRLSPLESRTVLGCGVAAAVSASFNAPIAGALFALEVVLGHYAIRAFAPITIASVMGAVISRSYLGEDAAFAMPVVAFGSYLQFPAFVLLGMLSAFVAISMLAASFIAKDAMDAARMRIGMPLWMQPAAAGAALGVLALFFPHVLGVGYQTVSNALTGDFDFITCIVFGFAKAAAVAITLGGRFAGGVFSPALVLGALTGAAFGSVALDVFPSVNGSQGLYALAGMGAVAGSVLGAPISTTLIVVELTGDYGTAIAVMVSTSVATVATQQIVGRSYFHIQLARRSIRLASDPKSYLLSELRVSDSMRSRRWRGEEFEAKALEMMGSGVCLDIHDRFDRAYPIFEEGQYSFLPVGTKSSDSDNPELVGLLFFEDVLRDYNVALEKMHREEHT